MRVDDIYATCERLMKAGVTINRPPRDGRMAFVRSPDGISIELLQKGEACRRPSPGRRCPTPASGETRRRSEDRRVDQIAEHLAEISRYSGACIIRIANRASRGETQKAVSAMPPQKNSPTEPIVGATPTSVRTAKPRP